MKQTQMIVKRNVSERMVLTVRISCSGTWAGSFMIVSPMHEEMSFNFDVSRDQESRSRRLKSHSDHCAWSSGEVSTYVRKMVNFAVVSRR